MKKSLLMLSFFMATLTSCGISMNDSPSNSDSDQIAYSPQTHTVAGTLYENEYIDPLGTFVTLTMYNTTQFNETYSQFDNFIWSLNKEVDRYHTYEGINNLKTINDSYGTGNAIKVSSDLFELIQLGINLTKLSKGTFNLAMGSLIDLYTDSGKFDTPNTYNQTMPEEQLIQSAISCIPTYEEIDNVLELNSENLTIRFHNYEKASGKVILSLGAIAKGFVIQKILDKLLLVRNYPAIVNAGSSTIAFVSTNPNPNRDTWGLGFKEPILNPFYSNVMFYLQLKGFYNVSTSADNEKNFLTKDEEGNTEIHHHILSSLTGKSNSYHRSVSLISKDVSSAILDSLSTALFNIEKIEDIQSLIALYNETFHCQISFIVADAYNGSLSEYEVYASEDIETLVYGEMSSNVKKITYLS